MFASPRRLIRPMTPENQPKQSVPKNERCWANAAFVEEGPKVSENIGNKLKKKLHFMALSWSIPCFMNFWHVHHFVGGVFQRWQTSKNFKSPESLGIADHWYPTGAQNISFWYSLSYSHETHILLIRWWKPNFQHVAQKRGWNNPVVANFKPQWQFDTKMGIGWNR